VLAVRRALHLLFTHPDNAALVGPLFDFVGKRELEIYISGNFPNQKAMSLI
jgi:hypothetical protein